jgi:hypothetical protein
MSLEVFHSSLGVAPRSAGFYSLHNPFDPLELPVDAAEYGYYYLLWSERLLQGNHSFIISNPLDLSTVLPRN